MPEKEYIEREALLENLHKFAPEHNTPLIQLLVTRQPPADVAEVKHGYWVYNENCGEYESPYFCSECLADCSSDIQGENYCYNCGAKMDGDSNIVESCAKVMLRLCGTEYKYCDGICKNCNEPEYHATNSIQMETDNG
jgi:hypothetical protein